MLIIIFTLFSKQVSQEADQIDDFFSKVQNSRYIVEDSTKMTVLEHIFIENKSKLENTSCEKLNESSIDKLLESLLRIILHTQESDASVIMSNCIRSIDKPKAEYIDFLFRSYVSTMDFRNAQRIKAEFPAINLPPLPFITASIQSNQPTIYTLSKVDNVWKLAEKPMLFKETYQVIVIAHPLCHFTKQAVKSIQRSVNLSKFFNDSATWLVPAYDNLNLEHVYSWNEKYPNHELHYMGIRERFTFADSFGSPTFYFIYNGELLEKVVGWPDNSRVDELDNLLKFHFDQRPNH